MQPSEVLVTGGTGTLGAGGAQQVKAFPIEEDQRPEVDRQQLVEQLGGATLYGPETGHSGTVDEDVEAPVAGLVDPNDGGDVPFGGDVRLATDHPQSFPPKRPHGCLELLGRPADEREVMPLPPEHPGLLPPGPRGVRTLATSISIRHRIDRCKRPCLTSIRLHMDRGSA